MSKTMPAARLLAAVVAAIAVLGLATSAQAVTITSASPTTGLSNNSTVTVKLSFSGSEALYAISQCNDDQPDGLACNTGTAIGLNSVASFPPGGEVLTVNNPFTNGSLIPGFRRRPPTTSTSGT